MGTITEQPRYIVQIFHATGISYIQIGFFWYYVLSWIVACSWLKLLLWRYGRNIASYNCDNITHRYYLPTCLGLAGFLHSYIHHSVSRLAWSRDPFPISWEYCLKFANKYKSGLHELMGIASQDKITIQMVGIKRVREEEKNIIFAITA